jgi:hypothetical protein
MLVFGLMMAAASGIAIEYRLRIDQSEMVDRQTALEDLNRDINASYELLVQEKSSIQQHMSDEYNRISSVFDTQRAEIERLYTILESQNLLIAGLTGQSDAIDLPAADWVARLNDLELVLSDSTRIEENITQAALRYDEVFSLVIESSPWVQSFYLDRLMSIRWSADAYLHLSERASQGWRELDNYIAERQELIAVYPLNANNLLYGFVTESMDELTRDADSLIREQVLIEANERISTAADIDQLYDSLNWLDEIASIDDQEVQAIRSKVELQIQEIEAAVQATDFEAKLAAIPDISPELRASAASILLNDMTQYRLALEQIGLKNDDLAAAHERLSDYLLSIRQQEEQKTNEMLRGYRRWALTRIVEFERLLERHRTATREGMFSDGLSDTQYFRHVRRLVRENLLLINEVHLDYLLAGQYQKALGAAISLLSSEDIETARTELSGMIEDSVTVVRKNPIPVAPYQD